MVCLISRTIDKQEDAETHGSGDGRNCATLAKMSDNNFAESVRRRGASDELMMWYGDGGGATIVVSFD
jgi:hypothetical protein